MKSATAKRLDDRTWFAEVEGLDGVWANEDSLQEAVDALPDVILDWAILKASDGDSDILEIPGLSPASPAGI